MISFPRPGTCARHFAALELGCNFEPPGSCDLRARPVARLNAKYLQIGNRLSYLNMRQAVSLAVCHPLCLLVDIYFLSFHAPSCWRLENLSLLGLASKVDRCRLRVSVYNSQDSLTFLDPIERSSKLSSG